MRIWEKNQIVVENKKEEKEKDLTMVRREKEVVAGEGRNVDGVEEVGGEKESS